MLYSKKEIKQFDENEKLTAVSRYLHKIEKNETKKFLPHECEEICSFLPHIVSDPETRISVHNIYELEFLTEALLKKLLLVYLENLDFFKPVYNGHRELTDMEIERDKKKFFELINEWSLKLESEKSDVYLHEVKLEYYRKLKILNTQFRDRYIGRRMYDRKILEQKTAAFYKYFITKSFFKDNKRNWISFDIFGETILINSFSYVHIISRHYMPLFNRMDSKRSFNGELLNIDPFALPTGLRDLIIDYLSKAPKGYSLDIEYMIFKQDSEFYIVWWKRKPLKELANKIGYEVRTLYKIDASRDFKKIIADNVVKVTDKISYFYPYLSQVHSSASVPLVIS